MARRRRVPPSRDPVGAPTLPGHRVVGPVGFGADGAVWAAHDAAGRDVVVSVLPLAPGSTAVRRLTAMRHGTHPHLARIRQVVSLDQHRCAVVSDRVDGPTLATVVAARGSLDDGELAGVLAGVGSALGHLHERGLVHGDLSPANVIVTPDGGVVLVDLAAEAARELGTPGFVPPERARGGAAGAPGDVWALARLLEWASGGGRETRVAAVLAPALAARPEDRPSARDLASGAPAIAAPRPVRVPPPEALAQARMRDAGVATQKRMSRRAAASAPARPAGPAPSAARGGSRHRRRHHGARVTRWAPAWSVAAGALLTAGVLVLAVPRLGVEPRAGPDLAVVAELLARRDTALATGDPAALAMTSVPASPAHTEDVELIRQLAAASARLEGLRIEATDLRTVATGSGSAVVEVLLAQSAHERVSRTGRTTVPAHPPGCATLELALVGAGEWRLVDSRPCP